MSTANKTTCPYCGVGCGVKAKVVDNQIIAVSGSRSHPANKGLLCVKGSALHETLSMEGRLLAPFIGDREASWPEAIERVAQGFMQTIAEHGPDSVAFYLSGQLLTEDYYVANKLMKGFIGSANVDTNSRLCMASAVAGYKRAFGSDTVPGNYQDLEQCDLLVLVGSNAAWTHPVLYQRIVAAKARNDQMKVVVIDPRRTATADIADLVLPIKPGSDAWLFNGLFSYLAAGGFIDKDYIAQHTQGYQQALEANQTDFCLASLKTGIAPDMLQEFYSCFAETEKSLTFYSQGINQSATGTDKCNAIINCHLATGRIGKPGSGPFSVTGQPNAMGGREVGGLANQLAAHMDFSEENCDRLQRFWQSDQVARQPGLKAVDLFDAVESGQIKAIWIMATNPVVSMPEADRVRAALKKCPLVVVSDCMAKTDTTAVADILLPATTWGEKDGTVTNSERCISRQRAILPKPGQARHDWEIICAVAKEMGFFEPFNFNSPSQIFAEHAALSGFENRGSRDFDISAFAAITQAEYQQFKPVRWPVNTENPEGTDRLFTQGKFFTPTGKANFVSLSKPEENLSLAKEQQTYLLNTGRIRDQWHTMTRTGKSARLLRHIDMPFVEIHPEDAKSLHISENGLVELSNSLGLVRLVARLTDKIDRGQLFAPMHWNDQFAFPARIDSLIPGRVDAISGQPQSKNVEVQIRALALKGWARIFTTDTDFAEQLVCNIKPAFWTRVNLDKCCRFDMAIDSTLQLEHLQKLMQRAELKFESEDFKTYLFRHNQINHSFAQLIDSFDALVSSDFAESCIARPAQPGDWISLAAQDKAGEHRGAMICSCFEVYEQQIYQAIQKGCRSAAQLGNKLKCGTNCGSCVPELNQMLANNQNQLNRGADAA